MGAASGAREGAVTGRGAGPSVPGPPSSTGRGSVPRGGGPGGRVGTLPWRGAAGAHLEEVGGEVGGGRALGEERDRAGHRAGGLRAAGGGEPEEDGEGGHGEGGGRRRAGKTKQLPIQVALGPGTAPRRFGGRGGRLGAAGVGEAAMRTPREAIAMTGSCQEAVAGWTSNDSQGQERGPAWSRNQLRQKEAYGDLAQETLHQQQPGPSQARASPCPTRRSAAGTAGRPGHSAAPAPGLRAGRPPGRCGEPDAPATEGDRAPTDGGPPPIARRR